MSSEVGKTQRKAPLIYSMDLRRKNAYESGGRLQIDWSKLLRRSGMKAGAGQSSSGSMGGIVTLALFLNKRLLLMQYNQRHFTIPG